MKTYHPCLNILSSLATAFVILLFLVYLLVAAWGCTMVKEGLERRKLSRYDSYSVRFYDQEDIFFRDFPYRIQVIWDVRCYMVMYVVKSCQLKLVFLDYNVPPSPSGCPHRRHSVQRP